MDPRKDRLLWIDLETTGLDPEQHIPLELGLVLTSMEGVLCCAPFQVSIIWPKADLDSRLDSNVRLMHTKNGLLDEVESFGVAIEGAVHKTLEWMKANDADNCMKAGSGLDRFDVPWLKEWFPDLLALMHYRTVDITTAGYLCGLTRDKASDEHRVLKDISRDILIWQRARSMTNTAATRTVLAPPIEAFAALMNAKRNEESVNCNSPYDLLCWLRKNARQIEEGLTTLKGTSMYRKHTLDSCVSVAVNALRIASAVTEGQLK